VIVAVYLFVSNHAYIALCRRAIRAADCRATAWSRVVPILAKVFYFPG
jgi:hypothetical protein